jgi:GWxTD domain-containing protein
MRLKYFLLLFCFLIPLNNVLSIDFDVDYASFRGEDGQVILEVYLMMPRSTFRFIPYEDKFISNALIRAALAQNDTVVVMDEWQIRDVLADTLQDVSYQKIPEISILSVDPGIYTLLVLVADLVSGEKEKLEEEIVLEQYHTGQIQISGIEICSKMQKTDQENKFSRYFGYDMFPNASSMFGSRNPVLYSFCEIYNLEYSEGNKGNKDDANTYNVRYSINDLNGNEVKASGWKTKSKPGESAVELNSMNITDVKSGIYDLKIDAVDNRTGDTAAVEKRIYIVKEAEVSTVSQLLLSEYARMTEEELDKIFGPLRYIATESEQRKYRESGVAGKVELLAHFWDKRDPILSTAINESKEEFEQRLAYVNENYSTSQVRGWKTDMGRVIIVYGFPSEIERYPSSLEKKPYQIWHYYDIEGGIDFVFVDKTGFGLMELVHSTSRNELQDYNWQRWIEPTRGSMPYEY